MRGNWVSVEGGIGCEEDGSYLHCCWPDLPKSASPALQKTDLKGICHAVRVMKGVKVLLVTVFV